MPESPAPYAAGDGAPIPSEPGYYWLLFDDGRRPLVADVQVTLAGRWLWVASLDTPLRPETLSRVTRYVGPLTPPDAEDG